MLGASDPRLTLRVGAAVLLLVALTTAWVVFLRSRVAVGSAVHVRVYFAHVGALTAGAPVRVAGRVVGKVEGISLAPASGGGTDSPLRGSGAVARVRIQRSVAWMVPINGEFFISSTGALSGRYLEVGPPRGGAAPARAVQNGDKIRGIDPPSIDDVLQRTWGNLMRAQDFLDAVGPEWSAFAAELDRLGEVLREVEPGPGSYDQIRIRVRSALDAARVAWNKVQVGGLDAAALDDLAARTREALDAVDVAGDRLRGHLNTLGGELARVSDQVGAAAPEVIADLRSAIADAEAALGKVDRLIASTRDLVARFERGEGSIARIMRDPEFPEDAKALGKALKRAPWRVVSPFQDDEGADRGRPGAR